MRDLRRDGAQRAHRATHAGIVALQDVQRVDLVDLDEHDVPGQRALDDRGTAPRAPARSASWNRPGRRCGRAGRARPRRRPPVRRAGRVRLRRRRRRVARALPCSIARNSATASAARAEASRRRRRCDRGSAAAARPRLPDAVNIGQHRRGQVLRRAFVLHQLRHQAVRRPARSAGEAVDLQQPEALDHAVGQRRDPVGDHHRPLGQHRLERGGAGGEQHHVGGDHRLVRLAVEQRAARGAAASAPAVASIARGMRRWPPARRTCRRGNRVRTSRAAAPGSRPQALDLAQPAARQQRQHRRVAPAARAPRAPRRASGSSGNSSASGWPTKRASTPWRA